MKIKLKSTQQPFEYTFDELLRRLNQRIDAGDSEFYSLIQEQAYWVGRPNEK